MKESHYLETERLSSRNDHRRKTSKSDVDASRLQFVPIGERVLLFSLELPFSCLPVKMALRQGSKVLHQSNEDVSLVHVSGEELESIVRIIPKSSMVGVEAFVDKSSNTSTADYGSTFSLTSDSEKEEEKISVESAIGLEEGGLKVHKLVTPESKKSHLHNNVPFLIGSMARLPSSKGRLSREEIVCALLATTQQHAKAKDFVDLCGVYFLLKTMDELKSNLRLQQHSLKILLHLSQTFMDHVAGQNELINVILSIMTEHCMDDPLQNMALILLNKLVSLKDNNVTDKIIRANGVHTIINSIKAHSTSAYIIHYGCITLSILCESQLDARIETAKSLSFLLTIAKNYELDVFVFKQILNLLASLRDLPSEKITCPQDLLNDAAIVCILSKVGLLGKVKKRRIFCFR